MPLFCILVIHEINWMMRALILDSFHTFHTPTCIQPLNPANFTSQVVLKTVFHSSFQLLLPWWGFSSSLACIMITVPNLTLYLQPGSHYHHHPYFCLQLCLHHSLASTLGVKSGLSMICSVYSDWELIGLSLPSPLTILHLGLICVPQIPNCW